MGRSNTGICMMLGLVVPLLVLAGPAWADAIGPAPKDCPAGSEGTTSHCGPECQPLPCKSDKDCRNKKLCRATRLCIEDGQRPPCGRVPMELENKKYPYRVVFGKCPPKKACSRGTCVSAKHCMTPSVAPPPPPKAKPPTAPAPNKATAGTPPKPSSSSCQVASPGGSVWILLLGLVLVSGRRGRRRG